jgi:uncharacterized protein (TIGR03086 family)
MTDRTDVSDFDSAARTVQKVVAAVRDDQLGNPTPCTRWTVGDLLDHLLGLTVAFRMAAEKAPDPAAAGPPDPSRSNLHPHWRHLLPARLDDLVAAWRNPAAWTGDTEAGGVVLPAAVMGLVALNKVVVHGWDLAAATGQPYEISPETAVAVHSLVAQQASAEGTPGLYGPSITVPADAPLLDRVIGLTGRNPRWSSPVAMP